MQDLNEYQKVIDRDLSDKNYARDLKFLKVAFIFSLALFAAIYILGFHGEMLKNIKFVLTAYRNSLMSGDYEYKLIVYNMNRLLAFTAYMGLFGIFLLFVFFAYDIIQRNRLIIYYKKMTKSPEDRKRDEQGK